MAVFNAVINRLLFASRRTKRTLQVCFDLVVLTLCFVLAMFLRLDNFQFISDVNVWIAFFISLPLTILVFVRLGFYRAVIRYITSRAAGAVVVGAAVSALLLLTVGLTLRLPIPRSVPFIYALLLLVTVGGLRFLLRTIFRWEQARLKAPVLIYGAGSAGRQLKMSLQFGPEFDPVAFIDDSDELHEREIGGIPVYPPTELERLVADYGVEMVLLAIPSATRAERREILNRLAPLPVRVQTIPGISDLISGREKTSQLRQVSVEDLLGRDPVKPRPDLMNRDILDKVVMVTGAGGSIGSELCRQILTQKPKTLILFDIAEFALYAIDQDLRRIAREKRIDTAIVPLLGSVCDRTRLASILGTFAVETIYHAAAYKHVPLVEENVVEGIENNILGTRRVVEEALAAGVATFIMISTDKAVRPTNVMGATKRTAELICQAQALRQSTTRFSMVRFGNVLGSSGSVIPLFKSQIERGGPITVTHPEITRYFMTIPEAAQLVIQAGAMASGGEVFVLDMGDPVLILDLAKRMARLSGLKAVVVDPNHPKPEGDIEGDIEIVFSKLRPGEKLYEELLIDECATVTDHPRIRAATEVHLAWDELEPLLAALEDACIRLSVPDVRRLLKDAPIGYTPSDTIADRVWCATPSPDAIAPTPTFAGE